MATTTTPLELCHKLIALATNNPNEEESKLAALKAVKLIKEHNLLPGAPSQSRRPMPPPPQQRPVSPESSTCWGSGVYDRPFDDMFNYFYGSARGGGKNPFNRQGSYGRVTPEEYARQQQEAEEKEKVRKKAEAEARVRQAERETAARVKAANKGHEWEGIFYTCKRCKMGQALFNATGIGCHDYGRGEKDPNTGIPNEVLRQLDDILRKDPAKGRELQDILERAQKQNIKW